MSVADLGQGSELDRISYPRTKTLACTHGSPTDIHANSQCATVDLVHSAPEHNRRREGMGGGMYDKKVEELIFFNMHTVLFFTFSAAL